MRITSASRARSSRHFRARHAAGFLRSGIFALLFTFFLAYSPRASAQITNVTNSTSTPTPGSGHNYIKMLNETVNPANGSVSIRVDTPVAPGRQLTLPFNFQYDSNGALILRASYAGGSASFKSNTTFYRKAAGPTEFHCLALITSISRNSFPTAGTYNARSTRTLFSKTRLAVATRSTLRALNRLRTQNARIIPFSVEGTISFKRSRRNASEAPVLCALQTRTVRSTHLTVCSTTLPGSPNPARLFPPRSRLGMATRYL